MATLEQLKNKSETRIFKAVFPNTTNHYDTLFGGTTLHMMDEASFICATRFSRKKVVTVSTDKIDFSTPIPQGSIVELVARVDKVGRTSCVVKVEIFMEDMYSKQRDKVVTGYFTFVAVDDNKKPIPII
ncbi:acyl-CoA thioesterase [Patiriisocius hiemis]|uniref:Acyl-CoA thioesterase n=1 Tax=Patiriisocius hiemis TaxID=3075604 RepID=A0ABU2Y8M8_9FLAO|nr:acyl-CoA thioesterase [Constantimarinum sp. W242]MDT0554528.1 acyl-CoA thioesterase [Constantimarinum sp. W242]